MKEMMEYTINSEYIKDIVFNKCQWNDKYPYNDVGILMFLQEHGIYLNIISIDNGYIWGGYDKTFDGVFSADYNEYKTFNDALNSALIEGICYLSLKK